MEPFGQETKTILLKHESHKLHQEFEVDALKATITFNADLVNLNVINAKVNGVAIAPVTFATDHDTTMGLLADALAAIAPVASASATAARVITAIAADPEAAFVISDVVVTLGATQATATMATDTNNIYFGQPVVLTSDGKVEPATSSHAKSKIIGISMHNGVGGELVTVEMKAMAIVFMEAGTSGLLAGPVKIHTGGRNTTTGYLEVDDASVDHTNQLGWSLDAGDDGDVVRVAIAV